MLLVVGWVLGVASSGAFFLERRRSGGAALDEEHWNELRSFCFALRARVREAKKINDWPDVSWSKPAQRQLYIDLVETGNAALCSNREAATLPEDCAASCLAEHARKLELAMNSWLRWMDKDSKASSDSR